MKKGVLIISAIILLVIIAGCDSSQICKNKCLALKGDGEPTGIIGGECSAVPELGMIYEEVKKIEPGAAPSVIFVALAEANCQEGTWCDCQFEDGSHISDRIAKWTEIQKVN